MSSMVLQRNRALILPSIYKQRTQVSFTKTIQIHKRAMMSGRSIYVARAAYHTFHALTSPSVLDTTSKTNKEPLIDSLVRLSLDHSTGTPQHKGRLLTSIINPEMQSVEILNAFKNQTRINNITAAINKPVDARVFCELPPVQAYHEMFGENIINIQANFDSVPGNFPAQTQSNHDYYFTLKNSNHAMAVLRPHDVKGGIKAIEEATRGHIGTITFNKKTREHIPVTTQTYTEYQMIGQELKRLGHIKSALASDGISNFDEPLAQAHNLLKVAANSSRPLQGLNDYLKFLMNNIHTQPQYNRSISFLFPVEVEYQDSPKFMAFYQEYLKAMPPEERLYNLDKLGDRKIVILAVLTALQKTTNKNIIDELKHLHFAGDVAWSKQALWLLAEYAKTHF